VAKVRLFATKKWRFEANTQAQRNAIIWWRLPVKCNDDLCKQHNLKLHTLMCLINLKWKMNFDNDHSGDSFFQTTYAQNWSHFGPILPMPPDLVMWDHIAWAFLPLRNQRFFCGNKRSFIVVAVRKLLYTWHKYIGICLFACYATPFWFYPTLV
jgi:hypothetical protein